MAAGSYSGRLVPFQIDQSGHQATQFDIGVHADKPVALLLSAYAPTIWSLGWTQNTRIVAVFATGYHCQAVAGLPPGQTVQVLDLTGRVVLSATLPASGPLQLTLPTGLTPGLYVVRGGGQARRLAVE